MFHKALLLNCSISAPCSFCFPITTRAHWNVPYLVLHYSSQLWDTTAPNKQLPWTNDYHVKTDCSATSKSAAKAARPVRRHVEDKLELTTSWIQPDTSISTVLQMHHSNTNWDSAITDKDLEVSQMNLAGSLQPVLHEEFSCSCIFHVFYKNYCFI